MALCPVWLCRAMAHCVNHHPTSRVFSVQLSTTESEPRRGPAIQQLTIQDRRQTERNRSTLGNCIFLTDDTSGYTLHTLNSALGPAAPVRRYLARWRRILYRRVFPAGPDNPEGAAHQLQLFGGIFAQITQRIAAVRAACLCRLQLFFVTGE